MDKKLVNLTLPVVIEEIENILETYPENPYRRAFAPSNLRQDLVAYVLSHIHNTYKAIEETQEASINTKLLSVSLEQQLHLESWIHIGIRDVLHMNYNWDNC